VNDLAVPEPIITGRYITDDLPVTIPIGAHVLIAGVTRSGKSGVLNSIIGSLARRSRFELRGIDLKFGVELEAWRPILRELATTPAEAWRLLGRVELDVERRAEVLKSRGQRRWHPQLGPFSYVLVDEVAELVTCRAKRDRLDSLMRRSLALGVVFVLSTQYPTVEVISSQARAQCEVIVCLRLTRIEHARVVLGPRAVREGLDPTKIDPAERGRGIVQVDGKTREFQAAWLSDEEINSLVRGRHVRPQPGRRSPNAFALEGFM